MSEDSDFQLVLQLPCNSSDDYRLLMAIEAEIESRLEDSSWVDGHDIGSGTMNLFIYTSDPAKTFEILRPVLHQRNLFMQAKVAFRLRNAETFKWIHPTDCTDIFTVL